MNHLQLQSPDGWHSFYVLHSSGAKAAIVHFHLEDHLALSPFSAPFGSVEFTNLPPKVLFEFLGYFETELRVAGAKKIIIKDAPSILRPVESALLHTFLLNQGFVISNAEVSSVILVDVPDLSEKLASRKKQKLRQVKSTGLRFEAILSTPWNDIYRFISGSRKAKGYKLSMTEQELGRTIQAFPDRFLFFSVKDGTSLAAACISILIGKNTLFTFYTDHHTDYDSLSPSVMLYEGIYQYCKDNEIHFLDLGTSAINGLPNFGLLNFKFQLGAIPSAKLTFEKDLG